MSAALFPVFLKLAGRRVLVVGGGPVATSKIGALVAARAEITVSAPVMTPGIDASPVTRHRREFRPDDVEGAWLVVAAATPEVNREVARAAEARGVFVNAVDDPPNATAYLGGVVRRAGVTLAISTNGQAPALAGLLGGGSTGHPAALARHTRADGRPPPAVAARPERAVRASGLADLRAGGVAVSGFVSLVGAGPGDPQLLTRAAYDRLERAELVLYDALVSNDVLALAPRAQRFYVGKRAGRTSMSQETINRLLVRAARRGRPRAGRDPGDASRCRLGVRDGLRAR